MWLLHQPSKVSGIFLLIGIQVCAGVFFIYFIRTCPPTVLFIYFRWDLTKSSFMIDILRWVFGFKWVNLARIRNYTYKWSGRQWKRSMFLYFVIYTLLHILWARNKLFKLIGLEVLCLCTVWEKVHDIFRHWILKIWSSCLGNSKKFQRIISPVPDICRATHNHNCRMVLMWISGLYQNCVSNLQLYHWVKKYFYKGWDYIN